MIHYKRLLIIILASFFLGACRSTIATPAQNTAIPKNTAAQSTPTPTATKAAPTMTKPPATPTPQPTQVPVALSATVWEDLPQVPILMYHRFNPQPGGGSYSYTTSLSNFQKHLNLLYEAGFSLVSLNDWLLGKIHVPEGRRPLIITIDDLFYADQLSLDEDGQPADYSGLGLLWHFSQDHPDFNFHVAMFYNFGDKGYANTYTNGSFTVQDGWRQDRSEAIAWGIKNGAIPYNHFFDHPFLDRLSPDEILWQLEENETALREALGMIGEEQLAENLPNILALPYVIWPNTEAGKQALFDYTTPEGTPLTAILEGDHAANAKLFPAPFSPDFDALHVARFIGTDQAINFILDNLENIPTASVCALGEFTVNPHPKINQILTAILDRTRDKSCPTGFYIVDQLAFHVQENGVIQLSP